MKIHAVTVCVNYADLLAISLPRWLPGLSSLIVVTTPEDHATQDLCDAHDRGFCFTTSAFTARGATFNKGAALNKACQFLPDSDWILFFDADIVPPPDWHDRLQAAEPRMGFLNGARRVQAATPADVDRTDLPLIPDGEIAGYFHLFCHDDPYGRKRPFFDDCWPHAGNYDSFFMMRWPAARRHWLPGFQVTHIGECGRNWWGRGNTAAMDRMVAERKKFNGYEHERLR